MMRDPNAGGWIDLPDGDARLRQHLEPEPPKGHIMKVLYLYKNQIMYDVDTQINMITNMRTTDNGMANNVQTYMLDRYKAQFDRWIDKQIEKVKTQLAIAVVDFWNYAKGDELKDWAEKEIRFAFPHWWDDTAWRPLVDTIHDFIVNGVVSEYLKVIMPNDPVLANKLEDADDDYRKIKVLLCQHKQGSIKKPLRPLGF